MSLRTSLVIFISLLNATDGRRVQLPNIGDREHDFLHEAANDMLFGPDVEAQQEGLVTQEAGQILAGATLRDQLESFEADLKHRRLKEKFHAMMAQQDFQEQAASMREQVETSNAMGSALLEVDRNVMSLEEIFKGVDPLSQATWVDLNGHEPMESVQKAAPTTRSKPSSFLEGDAQHAPVAKEIVQATLQTQMQLATKQFQDISEKVKMQPHLKRKLESMLADPVAKILDQLKSFDEKLKGESQEQEGIIDQTYPFPYIVEKKSESAMAGADVHKQAVPMNEVESNAAAANTHKETLPQKDEVSSAKLDLAMKAQKQAQNQREITESAPISLLELKKEDGVQVQASENSEAKKSKQSQQENVKIDAAEKPLKSEKNVADLHSHRESAEIQEHMVSGESVANIKEAAAVDQKHSKAFASNLSSLLEVADKEQLQRTKTFKKKGIKASKKKKASKRKEKKGKAGAAARDSTNALARKLSRNTHAEPREIRLHSVSPLKP